MKNIQEVTPSDVVRAYVGKPGCMCGCRGKYFTAVADGLSEVNPTMVTKVLRTIQANEDRLELDSAWAAVSVSGKDYVIYFS